MSVIEKLDVFAKNYVTNKQKQVWYIRVRLEHHNNICYEQTETSLVHTCST